MSLALFAGFYVSREHCCLHWFYRMSLAGKLLLWIAHLLNQGGTW